MNTVNFYDVFVYICKGTDPSLRSRRLQSCARHFAGLFGEEISCYTEKYGNYGKPYFSENKGVHYSISHSGEYWMCAFHKGPIGFDMQEHKAMDYENIAKHWFHPQEYESVLEKGANQFYDIWCAKESYLKYMGIGLCQPMKEFSVIEENKLKNRLLDTELVNISKNPGYSLCICAEKIINIYFLVYF